SSSSFGAVAPPTTSQAMNLKTTYILFGTLAALLAVLGLVLYLGPTSSDEEPFALPEMHDKTNPLPTKDVQKVTIERKQPKGDDVVRERVKEDTWKITSPRNLNADSGNGNAPINALYDARVDEVNKPNSFAAAGLDEPQRIVPLEGKEQ